MLSERPDAGFRFSVMMSEEWNVAGTRADGGDRSRPASEDFGTLTLRGDMPSDTLFLHVAATKSGGGGYFNVVKTKTPHTRANPVTDESFHDSFGLFAYAYSGAWDETLTPDYMYNVEVTKESSWTTSYHWPGRRSVRFFAYAPYDAPGVSLSAPSVAGRPKITYTVPADAKNQTDLSVAFTGELAQPAEDNTATALTFRHALSAVRFVTGDDMLAGRIERIALKGVHGSGSYTLGDSAWSDYGGAKDFVQHLDAQVDGTAGTEVVGAETTFMMVPQQLPEEASVEVIYVDALSSTRRTLTASLGGMTWQPGMTYTYRLSTSSISVDYLFEVEGVGEYTYAGSSQTYTVTSHATVSHPGDQTKTVGVAWTTEFFALDEATGEYDIPIARPDWITTFTDSGTGAASAQRFMATVAAQTGIASNPHTAALQNTAARGSEASPYDLSLYTVANQPQSGMTTANCYVVSAPGWYKLPLVYGNAVKGGRTNSDSYNPAGTAGTNFLKPFVKHDNAAISAPCLADNSGVVPASAELLWNDTGIETYLTVSPQLSTYTATIDGSSRTLQYLVFNVPQESICQGNAVIAVKDASNVILWSWHIWITDENISDTKPVTNFMNETNRMMPVNLGHCDGPTTTYPERSVRVVFTQTESGATQSFVFTQSEGKVSSGDNSPYFQWGRKDAFLPSNGTGNADKIFFGTKWSYQHNNGATIGTDIQNPTVHYYNSWNYAPCNTTYVNLWSAKNTKQNVNYDVADEPVIKTVYDPCPPGFHVAPTNAFTGFSTTGQRTSTAAQFNVEGSWDTGWHFYCNKNKDTGNGTIFFPAPGYRDPLYGAINNVGSQNVTWGAVPGSTTTGRGLDFTSGFVDPVDDSRRSHGFSVRPVQE